MVLLQIAGGAKLLVNSGKGVTVTFTINGAPAQAKPAVVDEGVTV